MSAGILHDAIVANLIGILHPFAIGRGVLCASNAGYRIRTDKIRSPDVSFIRKERLPEGQLPKGFADFAPDLAVEVLPPEPLPEDIMDLGQKLGEYLVAGVQQVWLVDPKKQTVTVYRSLTDVRVYGAGEELEGGDLLPNFRCKVADLFTVG